MLPSLRNLEYLVATAETGNVTQAAKRLNVSQPSVSAAIAHIEAELGLEIFIRHHAKGVTLTPVGASVVKEARHLLRHARDFQEMLHSLGDSIAGDITMGCFLTLATRYMPSLLAEFSRRAPNTQVRVHEGDQQEIIDGLTSGQIEVALAYAFAVPDNIIGERLAELPPRVLIAADHPLACGKTVRINQLAEENFIMLDLPHSRDYFLSLFESCGLEPRISYRSRSYELIRGMVGHGQGFTIHNALPNTPMAYDGSRIAVLQIEEPLQSVEIMSLWLARKTMRPAVRAFRDFLHEMAQPGGIFDVRSTPEFADMNG